jgi:hypothetical protein
VKELVANFNPFPTRVASSIIQIANARGDKYSEIFDGTRFIPLTYQAS